MFAVSTNSCGATQTFVELNTVLVTAVEIPLAVDRRTVEGFVIGVGIDEMETGTTDG